MLAKFLASLSVVLIVIWFVTAVTMPVTPGAYLDLTAPWWHMALHLLWVGSLLLTNILAVYLYWENRSRRRHKLTEQPPQ